MENQIEELRAKIIKGLKLTSKRLIEATAKRDGELVYSINHKIVRIKAKELLSQID